MAADETSICNLALGLLGQSQIMSLDDASQAARFCKRFYSQSRDEVLQAHPWNFAMRRMTLSQLSTPPSSGWAAQYQLPTDCLRVTQMNGMSPSERPGLFSIEGRALLTDADVADIRYIARVEDANFFSPLFIEALSVKLGMRLCQPLTGNRSQAGDLLSEYERITGPKARRTDAFEGHSPRLQPWVLSDLVRARYGGQ